MTLDFFRYAAFVFEICRPHFLITHTHDVRTSSKNMVPGLYDPFGLSKGRSEAAKAKGRSSEIKNGRLAMIGVAGLWAAATLDGSVPLQPPC
jgi:hypothetical protein